MEHSIRQLRAMLTEGMHMVESVEFLCNLTLSQQMQDEDHRLLHLMGDVLFAKREYRRAMAFYRRALSACNQSLEKSSKHNQQAVNGGSAAAAGIAAIGGNVGARKIATQAGDSHSEDVSETALVVMIGKCHLHLGDGSTALQELESIPSRQRSVEVNMLLGRLYRAANLKRLAVSAYKAAYAAQPYSHETLYWLYVCGVEHAEILALVDEAYSATSAAENWHDWVRSAAEIMQSLRTGDHRQLAAQYDVLIRQFPGNLWLMGQMARSLAQCQRLEESAQLFAHMRSLDPLYSADMEYYALALFELGQRAVKDLSALANDMMSLGHVGPVSWLAASLFCQLQGDHSKARTLVEKAIEVDPQPVCFLVQGRILTAEGKCYDQALLAYYQANSLCREFSSLSGLVLSHLAMGKVKDAIAVAKDAVALMPKAPKAYLLIGQCLLHVDGPGSAAEAMKVFTRALRLDPSNVQGASTIANILTSQGKLHEAALCLRSALDHRDDYRLRTEFAKVLRSLGNYTEAIEQLQLAAGRAPADYPDALTELEQVESMLRSETRDAEDDNA